VQWGFFNGVCPGSDGWPLEVSCDLIAKAIVDQKNSIIHLKDFATETRTHVDQVWIHEHKPATWERGNRHSSYVWRRLLVNETIFEKCEVKWENKYKDHNGRAARGAVQVKAKTHDEAILELNRKKANEILIQATKREEYVKWLEDIVAKWQLKSLQEIV